jgi:hypothetical protein
MAAVPPQPARRRPRPGSLERPVNGRLYRGTWLLLGLPLLVLAFSVARPAPLPPPPVPPAFDRESALGLATDLANSFPNRFPGSEGAARAAQWFRDQLKPYGLVTRTERFSADVPGVGRVRFANLLAIVPGRSPQQIVVMAHRDDDGTGQGANDNASGTAALLELARAYAVPVGSPTIRVRPAHTLLFLSTDGGAFGGLGAAEFLRSSPNRRSVVAVVNLDSIAGRGRVRLEFAGDVPRSPSGTVLVSAAARIARQTGHAAARPSVLRQLVDLGFPFSLYEQAPFVAASIPAVTITTSGDRPVRAVDDKPDRLRLARLGQVGRAAQDLIGTLDEGLPVASGAGSYVYLGARMLRGWAIELVLIASLLPFLAAAVDLFARCRRRRIRLAPALRAYRSRLLVWLWALAVFELFRALGAWPRGADRPPATTGAVARDWPTLALVAVALLALLGWLLARERLLPRREVSVEDELAGHTVALLCLGGVSLLVVGTNPFALLFVLPSLHAWLWLPHVRRSPWWARAAVYAAGLAGPGLLLWSFGSRFGLGWDAPWYVAELHVLGYVGFAPFAIGAAWAAAGAQLATLTVGRYAPYPDAAERPPRGPVRQLVRSIVLASRRRRRASAGASRAFGG